MMFESVNYTFLLQDFAFAAAVGFAVAVTDQIVSLFIYRGRISVFFKDTAVCILFAVAVFSYVVSFANYPVVRIYHIMAAALGFVSFQLPFSGCFHKIYEKFLKKIKHYISCLLMSFRTILCGFAEKHRAKKIKKENFHKKTDLKKQDIVVYNL